MNFWGKGGENSAGRAWRIAGKGNLGQVTYNKGDR
jgi:hypothetical protein